MRKEWKEAKITELDVVATAQNPPVPLKFDGVLNADGTEQSGLGKASGTTTEIQVQLFDE